MLGREGMRRLYEGQSRKSNGEGVRQGNGRRAMWGKRGGGTHTIKTLYGGRELLALHSIEKKLGSVFTAPLILCRNDSLGHVWL